MAYKGKVIRDNFTTIEFLETAADTNNEYVKFKFTTKPGGFKPVVHLHLLQDESFRVLSGRLTCLLNGKVRLVEKGEQITLPKNVPHTHYNNENEELVLEQIISPALDSEIFLENLFGLTVEGKVKNGQPKLLQILIWLKELKTKTYLAAIPVGLQNLLSTAAAPVARVLGYKASYKRFSGIDI